MLGRLGLLCCAAAMTAGCTFEPVPISKMSTPIALDVWTAQDHATNVQDWHRMSKNIVDEMQVVGLLSPRSPIYVSADQQTSFSRELARAVRTELIHRGGVVAASPNSAAVLSLDSDIVVWGSRAITDPSRVRSEGVWHATVTSGNRIIMSAQKPFYIYVSDVGQYANIARPLDASLDLARSARPISYTQ